MIAAMPRLVRFPSPVSTVPERARAAEEPSDAQLVRRCAAGDPSAWEALVLRYRRLVYSIPFNLGLGPDDADDVFQTVFARLVRHVRGLREPAAVKGWLVTTTKRLVRRVQRRRRAVLQAEELLPALADEGPGPASRFERLEERRRVRRALSELDPRSRRLLELLYYDGERSSYARISRELAMPVGSIGPTRQRSLDKLRVAYEAQAQLDSARDARTAGVWQ